MPPRRGIRTSISTMSGSSSAALSTASAPSPASPTTWMSSSAASTISRPRRKQRVVVHDQDADGLRASRPCRCRSRPHRSGCPRGNRGAPARSCPPSFLPLKAVARVGVLHQPRSGEAGLACDAMISCPALRKAIPWSHGGAPGGAQTLQGHHHPWIRHAVRRCSALGRRVHPWSFPAGQPPRAPPAPLRPSSGERVGLQVDDAVVVARAAGRRHWAAWSRSRRTGRSRARPAPSRRAPGRASSGAAVCVFSRTTSGPSPCTSSEPILVVGTRSSSSGRPRARRFRQLRHARYAVDDLGGREPPLHAAACHACRALAQPRLELAGARSSAAYGSAAAASARITGPASGG